MNLRDVQHATSQAVDACGLSHGITDYIREAYMFGFGIDDIVYTALGVVALTLLAGLAARSKKMCDRVNEIARRCEQWHRDNGNGGEQ